MFTGPFGDGPGQHSAPPQVVEPGTGAQHGLLDHVRRVEFTTKSSIQVNLGKHPQVRAERLEQSTDLGVVVAGDGGAGAGLEPLIARAVLRDLAVMVSGW